MSEAARSELSTRLRRLPAQLMLALVNGTAFLVIVAAILAMIASSKVTHLAQNVASTMTDAVLSRVDASPRQVVQNIQRVSDDVHTLTVALSRAKTQGVSGFGPEVMRLNERLESLNANLEELRGARSDLIDEFVAKAGNALGEAFRNLRACPRLDGSRAETQSLSLADIDLRAQHVRFRGVERTFPISALVP
jgi:hypothetical protein